jgi:hypothetical protein
MDTPITREELHCRRIDMRGYRRSDGLFEVEGRVVDRKPFDLSSVGGSRAVRAREPLHDMGVRLTFDGDLIVRSVETFSVAFPYASCADGGRALQDIVGLRMAGGWSKEVRERLSGARSCTHLKELLIPMATVAFQTLMGERRARPEQLDGSGRPLKIDSCYAYRASGEIVRSRWPEFYRPKPEK